MKVLVQRVARASVAVDGETVGRIGRGLLVFVGVETGDQAEASVAAARKLAGLRVFADEAGRMNLDVRQAGGAVLVVSQFTLAGSVRKGRRPSFDGAAAPDAARVLVERLGAELEVEGLHVERGVFGADMAVELVNDGPVTFLIALRADGTFSEDGPGAIEGTGA